MEGISTYASSSRISCFAREKEEKRVQERKKNLLYLILEFLKYHGFSDTCSVFLKEAHLLSDIEVCDNIDLETILLEYSDYYFAKFNKYPKICRKGVSNFSNNRCKNEKYIKAIDKSLKKLENENDSINSGEKIRNNNYSESEPSFNIKVTPLFPSENSTNDQIKSNSREPDFNNHKILKSLQDLYSSGSELLEIASLISKEIVLCDLNVHWDNIKGLEECKNLLKEAAVYPIKYPHVFNDRLTPWKGVLLYGPPGTGKTMLAKAVATECKSTFFNITSSSLISKWRGESEKYVRVLLDLAKHYAPTIIFIDEVDWTVGGNHDELNSKSEPSRRFRAELLARLDGLLSMENNNVLLLAATNVPWELDTALLRRLEKRIYVGLPNEAARHEIFKIYLKSELLETPQYNEILKNTNEYSCSDLKLLCKEAWMMQLRPLWTYLEKGNTCIKKYKIEDGISNLELLAKSMSIIKPISSNIQLKYEIWDKSFVSKQ